MYQTIATIYVLAFLTFLPAVVLGLLAAGAFRAGLAPRQTAWALGLVAALLGLWAAAMVPLAQAGVLLPPPTIFDPPFALMPLIGGAAILWGLGRFTASGQAILRGLDQRHLVGFQIFRVMGGLFLLGWAMGKVPWQFALPAGIGDIWAGVAAIQALSALNSGAPQARALVVRANVIGLVDFVVAVSTGLITSEGFLHLLSRDAPNIINMYPLALFPAFFVPIFIAFHLFSLRALRSEPLVRPST
ncbi:MAG: hypothetical protein FD175_2074 [Beijerinckiaceae bacterium]|nr:MAG: hypothetical protein FD175_2074 [Beijerinckiaceae bacterium]